MIRIHVVTAASAAKRYYLAADYYTEGQEVIGRWSGSLTAPLGLSGIVDQQGFERLCDNLHPQTGKPLTPRNDDDRRVAYDFVFSAPKEFSVAEALAPEPLRAVMTLAFTESVDETMRDIEADMQTRVRRYHREEDRTTGAMICAGFDHSTARKTPGFAPDMHRHGHRLVFNVTWDDTEERFKAGQFGAIKRDGEYYTALFYSRLAARLEGLGVPIERRGGKEWGIRGMEPGLAPKFSKRTAEVEEEDARRRREDPDYRPEYKHELGAKTRARKDKELSRDQLRSEWESQLSPAERESLAAIYGGKVGEGEAVTAAQAAEYAVSHCFERHSVVAERELRRVALLHGLGFVDNRDLGVEFERLGVIVREKDGRQMATTREVQREENAIIDAARNGLGTVRAVGVPANMERGTLNDGQWQALRSLLHSTARINVLDASAGTGKSFLLGRYRDALEGAGEKVTFLATTAAAVEVLRKDGLEAETLARFLIDPELQARAGGGHVVVDEASMLGHRDACRLTQAAAAGNMKMLYVGDSHQHGAVQRGTLLHVLQTYGGIAPVRLSAILRQESGAYRQAVESLARGETLEGFDALDKLGWVQAEPSDQRYADLAAAYVKAVTAKESVLAVAPTHAEADRSNAAIRKALAAAGVIGSESCIVTRLVPVNATEAERGQASTYRAGDVLLFHQNAKGIRKGSRVTLAGPSDAPLQEAGKFQLYRKEEIELAPGDVLRFTGTVKTLDQRHTLKNGSVQTVAGFDRAGNIRLKNGWTVGADAGLFRYGFTETSFGSQGRTVDRVLVAMASASLPAINREQMYVSASRARKQVMLYTDDKQAIRDGIGHSSAKLAAADLLPPSARKPSRWEQYKRRLAQLRQRQVIDRTRSAWTEPSPPKERRNVHER